MGALDILLKAAAEKAEKEGMDPQEAQLAVLQAPEIAKYAAEAVELWANGVSAIELAEAVIRMKEAHEQLVAELAGLIKKAQEEGATPEEQAKLEEAKKQALVEGAAIEAAAQQVAQLSEAEAAEAVMGATQEIAAEAAEYVEALKQKYGDAVVDALLDWIAYEHQLFEAAIDPDTGDYDSDIVDAVLAAAQGALLAHTPEGQAQAAAAIVHDQVLAETGDPAAAQAAAEQAAAEAYQQAAATRESVEGSEVEKTASEKKDLFDEYLHELLKSE